MAALSAVKNQKNQKTRQKNKCKLQKKNNRIRKNLFIWAFGNVLFVQARHWRSDVEMSKRGRKDSGGFLYAFLILSCLVFKLSDLCVSQFAKNQVELLLAVLREGGVGIDEKEVRRSRKLFFLFLFSQKESFPVFLKKYCLNYLKFRRRNS